MDRNWISTGLDPSFQPVFQLIKRVFWGSCFLRGWREKKVYHLGLGIHLLTDTFPHPACTTCPLPLFQRAPQRQEACIEGWVGRCILVPHCLQASWYLLGSLPPSATQVGWREEGSGGHQPYSERRSNQIRSELPAPSFSPPLDWGQWGWAMHRQGVAKLSSVLVESRNVWDGEEGYRENQVPLLD